MSLLDELQELGANVEEGKGRFMGNVSLYERMLGKFPDTVTQNEIRADFVYPDYTEVITKAHTLKGVTGNLSLTPLYTAYTEVVNLLRGGEPERAKEIYLKMLPTQEAMIRCIRQSSQG